MRLIAVDPWDCRCMECITGEYVALREATDDQIADLLSGRLRDNLNSGTVLEVTVTYEFKDGRLVVPSLTVRYTHWDDSEKEWTPDPYRAGLVK